MEFKIIYFTFMVVFALASLVEYSTADSTSQHEGISLATFNTELVPLYVTGENVMENLFERAHKIMKLINESYVDIFCLQEVFIGSVQRHLYEWLKEDYPFIFSAQDLKSDVDNTTTACTQQNLVDFNGCIDTMCAGRNLTKWEMKSCVADLCAATLNRLGQPCRDCILLHHSRTVWNCISLLASDFVTNYGLMLLSKENITFKGAMPFNAFSQFKGYLEAYVPGVGNILCTHLTSLVSTEYYVGPPVVEPLLYQSYEQQQFHEIMILLEWLDNKKTPILMGDFNHGPVTVACSSWILPLHYGLLTARGMMSPYAMGEGVCTYYDYDSNWQVVIDHIYIPAHMHEKFEDVRHLFLNEEIGNGTRISTHSAVKLVVKKPKKCGNMKCTKKKPSLPSADLLMAVLNKEGLCKVY